MDTNKANNGPANVITMCKYNEICSKEKLCGDCCADKYEHEQYQEAVDNFNKDRKMELCYRSKY
uniref:Uncharacterized protein n=1 Tax=viral metagenome TaxID=1070528 RepID=A0A6C0IHI8_9ZZZZ